MTLGSLFDGSGGFPLAGIYAGMTPLWASEVEPYPIAVTMHRLPGMKHLGDVSKVSGADVIPVDVITFGSPCQDMSIAGKRAGMRHSAKGDEETTRSGMFYEAIRIIKEMRVATNGEYPKYAVWENVPGAFSSNKGEDFRCVIEEIARVADETVSVPVPPKGKWLPAGEIVGDGFSVAWRVLDAQYWGVPQRRKRIYLVADFGGERAGKILFERDGLSGHPQPGQAAQEGTADDAERGTGGSDRVECLNPWDSQNIRQYAADGVYPSLTANSHGGQNRSDVCYPINEQIATRWQALGERTGLGIGQKDDPAFTLQAAHPHMVCYALDSMSSNSMKSANPHSGFHEESVSKTLQADGVDPTCNQGGNVIVEPVAAFMGGQGAKAKGIGYSEDVAPTIKSVLSDGNTVPDVVYQNTGIGWWNEAHVAETLRTPCGGDSTKANLVVYALQGNGIDRAETAGCNGKDWRENECYTLNTIDRPAVVYEPKSAMEENCAEASKKNALRASESKSSHCVVFDCRDNGDGETVPTLTGDHQNRVTDYTAVCVMAHGQNNEEITQNMLPTLNCNHEQPIVAMEGSYKGRGQIAENISPALKASHPSDIAYGVDCRNAVLDEEKTHTLQAKANGGQSLNCTPSVLTNGKPPRRYIVRRLTPLECCRLQGFPDGWADIDRKDDFTDEELDFWRNVRNAHATINGKQVKEYTKAQMLKWYNGLQTDSSVYKMWGNGIALPCAQYVMEGIALALKGE